MNTTTKNTISQQLFSDLEDLQAWKFQECPCCGETAPAGTLDLSWRSTGQIEKELQAAIVERDAAKKSLAEILEEEMQNSEIRVALLEAGMESLRKRVKQLENENSELRDCLGEEWKK